MTLIYYSFFFLQCDPKCQNGTRSRTAWCERLPERAVVADLRCGCSNRPILEESCANVTGLLPCYLTPLWRTSEYSDVSEINNLHSLDFIQCIGNFKMAVYIHNNIIGKILTSKIKNCLNKKRR